MAALRVLLILTVALSSACGGSARSGGASIPSLPVCAGEPIDSDLVPGGPDDEDSPANLGPRQLTILNPDDIIQAMKREYPPLLTSEGVTGRALVWVLIGPDGRVREMDLRETTHQASLDRTAMRIARIYRFEPVNRDGCAVSAWATVSLSFSAR